MKVSFILMKFPVPSETFISNDIKGFLNHGIQGRVYTLLGKSASHEELLKQRTLEDVPLVTSTITRVLYGFLLMVKQPFLFLQVTTWILTNEYKRPIILTKCLSLLPISFCILKDVKDNKPDIVHLMWGHFPSIVGWLVKAQHPEVIISIFLGAYDLELKLEISASLSKKADIIWTHAKANIPRLVGMGVPSEKISLAYRGISLESLPKNFDEKEPILISAGRLIPQKGFDVLIKAFKKVVEHRPESKLVILGSGPEEESLIRLSKDLGIKDKVYFKGHLSQANVFQEMSKAKIFILPTTHSGERLPNVIKEAMGCRCYCLSSKSVGIEELLIDGKTGFVIPSNKAEAYAEKAIEILTNESNFSSILKNATKLICESFDRNSISKAYISEWKRLIEL